MLDLIRARRAPPAVLASPGRTAVVLDSPHSGTAYPDDFRYACALSLLRQAEDTHVEVLFDFHAEVGAAWVEATFPRSYLDVNRALTEVDLALLSGPWLHPVDSAANNAKLRLGKGLVWRATDTGEAIYDRLLDPDELRSRIDRCWTPYHHALAEAIADARARHGHCIHLNCHSMPAVAGSHATETPGAVHPDFVLGDRDGTTAAAALTAQVHDFLTDHGFDVAVNHPYKGVEIVRRHGHPAERVHSIQLEINRSLYMDERTLALKPAHGLLRSLLRQLVESLVAHPGDGL